MGEKRKPYLKQCKQCGEKKWMARKHHEFCGSACYNQHRREHPECYRRTQPAPVKIKKVDEMYEIHPWNGLKSWKVTGREHQNATRPE